MTRTADLQVRRAVATAAVRATAKTGRLGNALDVTGVTGTPAARRKTGPMVAGGVTSGGLAQARTGSARVGLGLGRGTGTTVRGTAHRRTTVQPRVRVMTGGRAIAGRRAGRAAVTGSGTLRALAAERVHRSGTGGRGRAPMTTSEVGRATGPPQSVGRTHGATTSGVTARTVVSDVTGTRGPTTGRTVRAGPAKTSHVGRPLAPGAGPGRTATAAGRAVPADLGRDPVLVHRAGPGKTGTRTGRVGRAGPTGAGTSPEGPAERGRTVTAAVTTAPAAHTRLVAATGPTGARGRGKNATAAGTPATGEGTALTGGQDHGETATARTAVPGHPVEATGPTSGQDHGETATARTAVPGHPVEATGPTDGQDHGETATAGTAVPGHPVEATGEGTGPTGGQDHGETATARTAAVAGRPVGAVGAKTGPTAGAAGGGTVVTDVLVARAAAMAGLVGGRTATAGAAVRADRAGSRLTTGTARGGANRARTGGHGTRGTATTNDGPGASRTVPGPTDGQSGCHDLTNQSCPRTSAGHSCTARCGHGCAR